MKKSVLVTLLVMLMAGLTLAQSAFTYNMSKSQGWKEHTFYTAFTLVGVDTLETDAVDISTLENAPKYGHYQYTSASAKPKIKLVRQEKVNGTWTDITAISVSDSLETLRAWTLTDTHTEKLTRFLIIGAAGNPADCTGWIRFTYLKR
jgi:hypothetical protein